ncbi:MAG: hypothetical protein P1U77_20310 [Rubripirellula sp.]|jgi:hypothetical protein|nr:hypothetical protein [Planctomycetaceae bacterium]MDF1843785.1 hypothetical protein [Rubripirellula sp.]
MAPKLLTSAESNATLEELQQELNRLQRKVRITIQTQLASITGRSLGGLAENRELIASIQEVLEGHGLRIQCAECGHPAILRVSPRPGSSTGVFVFDHTLDGRRTFHGGGSVVPAIKLVAKPPRKKRRRAAG